MPICTAEGGGRTKGKRRKNFMLLSTKIRNGKS